MAALTPGCRNGNGLVMGLTREPESLPHGPRNIADMKCRVVEYERAISAIRRHIAAVESDLDLLDPAAVVAVQVPFYTDPPERVEIARAARAALLQTPSLA